MPPHAHRRTMAMVAACVSMFAFKVGFSGFNAPFNELLLARACALGRSRDLGPAAAGPRPKYGICMYVCMYMYVLDELYFLSS